MVSFVVKMVSVIGKHVPERGLPRTRSFSTDQFEFFDLTTAIKEAKKGFGLSLIFLVFIFELSHELPLHCTPLIQAHLFSAFECGISGVHQPTDSVG